MGVNDDRCYNCGRRNPALWGFAPLLRNLGNDFGFVPFVIGTCVVMYALTLIFSQGAAGPDGPPAFLSPSGQALFLFGSSGAIPVFVADRWWTLLSANWLHGGPLHILFNMLWIRQLAPATAELYGAGRMVIIYLVAGIAGFALSAFAGAYFPPLPFLTGARFTVGASAAIFGLLGALVYYGRRTGSSQVGSQAVMYALIMGLFGFIMPGIDNYAHAGGFAGGYLVARVLDPLAPERLDHLLIAVLLLFASIVSILVSVLHGTPILRMLTA